MSKKGKISILTSLFHFLQIKMISKEVIRLVIILKKMYLMHQIITRTAKGRTLTLNLFTKNPHIIIMIIVANMLSQNIDMEIIRIILFINQIITSTILLMV